MANPLNPEEITLKPSRIGLAAVFLTFIAVVFRTLAIEANRPLMSRYLTLELAYFIVYVVMLIFPKVPGWLKHFSIVLQSAFVLYALSLRPEFDFLVVLFLLLTYQISLFFTDRMRWIWILGMVLVTGGSLIFYLGLVRGLALSLTTMAGEIVIPAFLISNMETEMARIKSQALLDDLQDTHRQLKSYASQVEGLAAVQERNRLARELHDTVSQLIFSINLTTRSAQLLLKKEPARVPNQLGRLQEMTTDALTQLRSLITQLRPPQDPEKKD